MKQGLSLRPDILSFYSTSGRNYIRIFDEKDVSDKKNKIKYRLFGG
jgi:hypothetical protein